MPHEDMEHQGLVAIDVSGSTKVKKDLGDQAGGKKVDWALRLVHKALVAADAALYVGSSAGDSLLLVGGFSTAATYVAAKRHLSHTEGLEVKIALGHDKFEFVTNETGKHARGGAIDFLFRILAECEDNNRSCLLASPAAYGILKEAGYGDQFREERAVLKGYGSEPQLFYRAKVERRLLNGRTRAVLMALFGMLALILAGVIYIMFTE